MSETAPPDDLDAAISAVATEESGERAVVIESVVEQLRDLLAQAEGGDILAIAFAFVRPNGRTAQGRAAPPEPHRWRNDIAAAVLDLHHAIGAERAEATRQPQPEGDMTNG